jgi:phage gpG-like protein
MSAFDFTVSGGEVAIKGFSILAQRATNLAPALNSIGQYMQLQTRSRFDTSTAPGGAPWRPLATSTVRAKQRSQTQKRKKGARRLRKRTRANPSDILKDTFLLRDTITYQAFGGEVAIGSPQQYAKFHQLGTNRTPRREFLGVSSADKAEIAAILADHLGRD